MTAYARLRHSGAGRRAGARLPVCPEQRNLEFLTLQGKKINKTKQSKQTHRKDKDWSRMRHAWALVARGATTATRNRVGEAARGGPGGKSCRRVRETRVNKQNSRKRTTASFCRLSRCGAQILTGGFSLLDPGASASSFRNHCVMATWCHKTDFTCCPHPSPNDRRGRARARELFLTILTYFSSRRVMSQTPPV